MISTNKFGKKVIGTLLIAAATTMSLAACEDPRTYRPITATNLKTYSLNNGDNYVELAVTLKTNSMQLPEIVMPVTSARTKMNLANLTIRPVANQPGLSQLLLAVNVTGAAGLEGATPTLPNGTVIPVSGVDMTQLVALPLDQYNKNGRIYLAVDTENNTAIMGAALTWQTLDAFGQSVGPLNFFPSFEITHGVKGIAGVFGSRTPGQSGVAVFADISQLLSDARGSLSARPVGQVNFLQ
jgi:hypothetical protein